MASSTMYTRVGLILYVQRYAECVAFYRDLLELRVLFETSELTCFEFGNGYLMVELDDQQPPLQRQESHAACLRLNVPNVKQFADALRNRGISVDYQEHPWGTVAKFLDPDGNLCAFKDDEKFEQQIRDGQS
jgi:lactoylglutathione lyase